MVEYLINLLTTMASSNMAQLDGSMSALSAGKQAKPFSGNIC